MTANPVQTTDKLSMKTNDQRQQQRAHLVLQQLKCEQWKRCDSSTNLSTEVKVNHKQILIDINDQSTTNTQGSHSLA